MKGGVVVVALLELAVFALLVLGGTGMGIRFLYRQYTKTKRYLIKRQIENRERIESEQLFQCEEHRRTFRQEQLVRDEFAQLYCPDCYAEHIVESRPTQPVMNLGSHEILRNARLARGREGAKQ